MLFRSYGRIPTCLFISSQIQFPALDIRLSYNDVQLFLAIAKSIPTSGTPELSDAADGAHAGTSAASLEPTSSLKDSFRHKTEALLGGHFSLGI